MISFAGARPEHPLHYWLSPELARISPPNAPSRLRQLADAQGSLAAAWSSAISGGPVLILGGVVMVTVLAGPGSPSGEGSRRIPFSAPQWKTIWPRGATPTATRVMARSERRG